MTRSPRYKKNRPTNDGAVARSFAGRALSFLRRKRGVGLVGVLLIVAALSMMGATLTVLVATGAVTKTNDLVREQAFYLNHAGFEYALMRKSQGVDPTGTYNLGNGRFTVTYAQSGLITINSSVNAMMGASSPTFTIQGPPASVMADCLTVGTGGASLQSSNTVLAGITLQNTCATPIVIAAMQTSWSPALNEKLTQIVINGSTVFTNAGISSGAVADIDDATIPANTTVNLNSITFNSSMAGKNFVILFTMSDASTKSANVQFACGTMADGLYVDTAGANIGASGYVRLLGITLADSCSTPITIKSIRLSWVPVTPNRTTTAVVIDGITRWSGGAIPNTTLTFTTPVTITAGQTVPQDYINFNGDMRGRNVTIIYTMNDNSTKTVAVNLYSQTPNTCLNIINTGCVIGGAGNVEIQGQQWQNTCPLTIVIDRLTPVFTGGRKIRSITVNGVTRWSGNANSNTNLTFTNFVELPGSTTWTVDSYRFNGSMVGNEITSETFRFFPFATTYAYSATTCP